MVLLPARGTHPSWLLQQACTSQCRHSTPSPQLQAGEFPGHGEKGRRRAFSETGPQTLALYANLSCGHTVTLASAMNIYKALEQLHFRPRLQGNG